PARRLREDRIIAAEIEEALRQVHELLGRMLVLQRAQVNPRLPRWINRPRVSRIRRPRIDMHKPRRPKPEHAAVALRKRLACRFEINRIRLERAVHPPPRDVAND